MAAYLVVDSKVKDLQKILKYRELAQQAVSQYGGRYLARGGACTALEGNWQPERLVIVEFPSSELARQFYDSPEYLAAREARAAAADFDMLLVEGT
ncbi:MAG: DUF1330 domain-containing protein [Betaproteobacteria bacterium]|nr:DUF1330 domain-containing protein [Betaproteobacteria bacterium]